MTHPQPPPDGAGRAEFEAAWVAASRFPLTRDPNTPHDYAISQVQAGWLMWQAARSRPAPPAAEPVGMTYCAHCHAPPTDKHRHGCPHYESPILPAAPAPAGPGKEGG